MQDFPRLLDKNQKVGFSRFSREACFTCVKNNIKDAVVMQSSNLPPESMLTCEADIYANNARMLKRAGEAAGFRMVGLEASQRVEFLGITQTFYPLVVLHPSWAVSLTEMKSRISGDVKLAPGSVLVLEGDVELSGLELDGALVVRALKGSRVVLKDLKVQNAGWMWTKASTSTMEKFDHIQIRGYVLDKKETCEKTIQSGDAVIISRP